MSYVVHVWEHPEPRTLKDADLLHSHLSGRRAAPNPKWRLLGERVEAEMAARGAPLEEWPESSPPDPAHAERTMSFLVDDQEGFLEALVLAATSLGLSVYDDQAARLYLPFGYVLTWDGLVRLQAAPPRLGIDALDEVMNICERAWAPRFAASGYALRREPYDDNYRAHRLVAERKVPVGTQVIEIRFSADQKENRLSFEVCANTFPELSAAASSASGTANRVEVWGKEFRGLSAFMVEPRAGMPRLCITGPLRTQSYVDRLIDGVFEYIDQEIEPTLDGMREAADLIRLAIEQDAPGEVRDSRATLALAWMIGNATLDKLNSRIWERDRWWIENLGQPVYEALRKLPR